MSEERDAYRDAALNYKQESNTRWEQIERLVDTLWRIVELSSDPRGAEQSLNEIHRIATEMLEKAEKWLGPPDPTS